MNYETTDYGCPILPFIDPPKGEGFQLWETITEGSPLSPVFDTPEELTKWLADNLDEVFSHDFETWKDPG